MRDLAGGLPIAVSETAFSGEPTEFRTLDTTLPGSPRMQSGYLESLFATAQQDNYEFIVWFLYHDYDAFYERYKNEWPDWFKMWMNVGFLDENHRSRPALDVWRNTLAVPLTGHIVP